MSSHRPPVRGRGVLPISAPWLLALALVGCGGRPAELADRQIAMRSEQVTRTFRTAVDGERSRGPTATLNAIQKGEQLHARLSDENVIEMQGYWHRDWQRWNDRQRDYQRKAGQILWGEPERIPPNGIKLFF